MNLFCLSNNGKSQIALVPSEYTSQMDSIDHCIYMTENDKGKLVKVDKKKSENQTGTTYKWS